MNIADQMIREERLKTNLSRWMEQHGTVLYDRSQRNAYVDLRIVEVLWKNIKWRMTEVDGMTCRIERI